MEKPSKSHRFVLCEKEGVTHVFHKEMLANYFLGCSEFRNPLTQRPLTCVEINRLSRGCTAVVRDLLQATYANRVKLREFVVSEESLRTFIEDRLKSSVRDITSSECDSDEVVMNVDEACRNAIASRRDVHFATEMHEIFQPLKDFRRASHRVAHAWLSYVDHSSVLYAPRSQTALVRYANEQLREKVGDL